jgi:hypothetical protein
MKTRITFIAKTNLTKLFVFFLLNLFVISSFSQVTGDYRTRSGATTWNSSTSWQRFNGSSFVNYATPPSTSFLKKITVMHSITFDLTANVANLEIKDGATLTLSEPLTISGELSLTSGQLDLNGETFTIADGATIYRVNGSLSAAPTFDGTVNVTYNEHTAQIQSGYELPTNAATLFDLTIWSSNGVKLMQNATVNNAMYLTSGQISLNGYTLSMADATTIYRSGGSLSGAISFGSSVNVEYDEYSSEITTGYELPSSSSVLSNLTINNSMNIALASDITVNGTMDFWAGKFSIGTKNLTIASTGTISNYSSDYFIVAGDGIYRSTAGKVVRFINSSTATADQIFPIGTLTSYTPCFISNSNATGTNFRVNLFDEVLENGNLGTPITGGVLKRTWNITAGNEGNASGTTNIKIQWVTSDEALNFSIGDISLIRNAAGTAPDNIWETSSGTFSSETGSSPYKMQSSGVTSFGYFTGKGGDLETGGTLPVALMDLKAECLDGKKVIAWSTASEINNDFFTVEKSNDAANWDVLGIIPGSGNSNEIHSYNMLDRNESKSVVYYRLKQTDFNGSLSYSRIITSKNCLNDIQANMEVFPNPFDGVLNLTYNSIDNLPANVSVFDATGKTVYKTEINSTEGFNSNSIDLKILKDGIYYLKLENGDKTENFKLLKK